MVRALGKLAFTAVFSLALAGGGDSAWAATEAPVKSEEGKETGNRDVQQLAEYLVTETTSSAKPFQNNNLDVVRTSNDVQPYTIINRAAIEQSNRGNLQDFLKDELTQNTVGATTGQLIGGPGTIQRPQTSSINLRGLGTLQTLILVNGHRVVSTQTPLNAGGAVAQPDLNNIPLGAVDHIEVIASGASGIYGASAVGGMVNVILKKNYTGAEFDIKYQNTFGTDAPLRTYNMSYGFRVGQKTSVALFTSYAESKPLVEQDRPFILDYYRRAVRNSPAAFYSNTMPYNNGATPNIALNPATVNGFVNAQTKTLTLKNGTPLNAVTTYIPVGTSPTTSVETLNAGLTANAGTYNFDFPASVFRSLNMNLGVGTRYKSFMTSIHHELTPKIELHFDFSYSPSETTTSVLQLTGGQGRAANFFAVPGNAPSNPFKENVLVSMPLPASQAFLVRTVNLTRVASVGLLGHLPANWEVAADLTWSNGYNNVFYGKTDFSRNGVRGGGTIGVGGYASLVYNGTINPFLDTMRYGLTNLATYTGNPRYVDPATLTEGNLRAAGPIFNLPAGQPKLTVGLQARLDAIEPGYFATSFTPVPGTTANQADISIFNAGQRQTAQAIYLEGKVPLVSERNRVPFIYSLELQAVGRSESFDIISNQNSVSVAPNPAPALITNSATPSRTFTKFRSNDSTIGFKYKAVKTVTLRASYATAFLPPIFAQLYEDPNPVLSVSVPFIDPVNGQTYTALRTPVMGNSKIKPQTTDNWNAGIIWEPEGELFRGFRVNLEYYNITQHNLIKAPGLQLILNSPATFPGAIVRDPTTGLVTLLTVRNSNVGTLKTDGWDISADYRRNLLNGTFSVHAAGTIIEHLTRPPVPENKPVEYVGYPNSGGVGKTKANTTFTWQNNKWNFGWSVAYFGAYKQSGAPADPVYLGAATYTPVTTETAMQGGYKIPGQIYHNAFASYRFQSSDHKGHRLMNGVTVQVGVNNVFGTIPPFDAGNINDPYFYSPYGNVRLRDYVLKIRKVF